MDIAIFLHLRKGWLELVKREAHISEIEQECVKLEIVNVKKHVASDEVLEDEVNVSYADVTVRKRKPSANVLSEAKKTLDRV
ncbi:hypothetical protein MtrunA17_Chr7g0234951 [Medicago truncatula]|nr:hypothetical protein MtrunA17_Chr7g0234951 [Medicago truncatula]